MATLSVRRPYDDGDILFASDFDAFLDDIETLINETQLNDDNIQDGGITGSTKLADATVTAGKLASNSVTTAKILDANVTADKLASDSCTTAKILNLAVTTAKINDLAVTTGKINDAAVTQAKRASLGQQVSTTSTGVFSTSGSTFVDVTNCTLSITTTGRPVFIGLQHDGTANTGNVECGTSTAGRLKLLRDATTVAIWGVEGSGVQWPPGAFWHIDVPAAGTYTYKVQLSMTTGASIEVDYVKLVAYEL